MKWCFGIATAWFSMRRCEPLDTATAAMHLPALQLFYALQYLRTGPPFAGARAVDFVRQPRRRGAALLGRPSIFAPAAAGGAFLLWCYLSLGLFHAAYLEALPNEMDPWAGWVRAREDEAGRRVRLHAT